MDNIIKAVRFKAEIFDRVQFLFEEFNYNDHQVHSVIKFADKLNAEYLKRAVFPSLDCVPILGCRFVVNTRDAWERFEKSQYEKARVFVDSEYNLIYQRIAMGEFQPYMQLHKLPQARYIIQIERELILA